MFKSRASRGHATTTTANDYSLPDPATHGTATTTHGPTTHATATATTDYGSPAHRSNDLHRPLLLATHILHWISALIVMGIAAYFIHTYRRNTHLVYWVSVAAIDLILLLPTFLVLSFFLKSHNTNTNNLHNNETHHHNNSHNKTSLLTAPLTLLFSYLWLTAFVFATQDYAGGRCVWNSPTFVDKCGLKRTIAAFAFLAFFTSLIATFLEAGLWHVQRFNGRHRAGTFESEKMYSRPLGGGVHGGEHAGAGAGGMTTAAGPHTAGTTTTTV